MPNAYTYSMLVKGLVGCGDGKMVEEGGRGNGGEGGGGEHGDICGGGGGGGEGRGEERGREAVEEMKRRGVLPEVREVLKGNRGPVDNMSAVEVDSSSTPIDCVDESNDVLPLPSPTIETHEEEIDGVVALLPGEVRMSKANLRSSVWLNFDKVKANGVEKAVCIYYNYLEEEVLPRHPDFDILAWWKSNGLKYPTLQAIAKDALAIPVSTVASESTFSTSGRVLNPNRNRLHPKTLEALMCAQSWLTALEREGEPLQGFGTINDDADDQDCVSSVTNVDG
ncbi:hypothetical protein RHMOL_Rhmol02G0225100 [Rhododendron molle]|uniref:Uncharacterized protein n=1 Tax=Rhododendron molle TaxID=49168 RepID=A0ACC0PUC8_RHOML|nr:hypothetical protein RHMOL_Rhmol02G0225100 [Rhododendron molle]